MLQITQTSIKHFNSYKPNDSNSHVTEEHRAGRFMSNAKVYWMDSGSFFYIKGIQFYKTH